MSSQDIKKNTQATPTQVIAPSGGAPQHGKVASNYYDIITKEDKPSMELLMCYFLVQYFMNYKFTETDFLTYHYNHAGNKQAFLDFLIHTKSLFSNKVDYISQTIRLSTEQSFELAAMTERHPKFEILEKFINHKKSVDQIDYPALSFEILKSIPDFFDVNAFNRIREFINDPFTPKKKISFMGSQKYLFSYFDHLNTYYWQFDENILTEIIHANFNLGIDQKEIKVSNSRKYLCANKARLLPLKILRNDFINLCKTPEDKLRVQVNFRILFKIG